MLAGHNVADIVVVLKTLPTKMCVGALGNRILEDLKKTNANEGKFYLFYFLDKLYKYKLTLFTWVETKVVASELFYF